MPDNTPDTEWEKIAEKWLEKESVRVSVLTDLQTLIKEIISSRDTYWRERVRKEKLGWEGYVVVDPQSNNYKCSPIFFSVKEAEKWRRDFGESALKVATVDVILKN